MWARRCGAPHYYPSRVRILIGSFTHAVLGFAIFRFLINSNTGYLDFEEQPAGSADNVLCMTNWPLQHEKQSWWSEYIDFNQWRTTIDKQSYMLSHSCPKKANASATCDMAQVPVHALSKHLGFPFGPPEKINVNAGVMYAYAVVFVYLGISLWFVITVHDLALTVDRQHDYILDLKGVRRNFPRLIKIMKALTGYPLMTIAFKKGGVFRIAVFVSIPFFAIWAIFVFAFIWWPMAVVAFCTKPVRLSRLAVFCNCWLFVFYGLALTLHALVFLARPDRRPMYSLTWPEPSLGCVCGCNFHITSGAILQVLLIGITALYKGLLTSFRCLKGLRRTRWANLFTVMFPVPLAVYPVMWLQPDGKPIQHREEGDPVQGEIAFDPFALMDEQPDSELTTVRLKPERDEPEEELVEPGGVRLGVSGLSLTTSQKREIGGPRSRTQNLSKADREEVIGCCGFPYSRKVTGERSKSETVDEEQLVSEERQEAAERARAEDQERPQAPGDYAV